MKFNMLTADMVEILMACFGRNNRLASHFKEKKFAVNQLVQRGFVTNYFNKIYITNAGRHLARCIKELDKNGNR